MKRVLFLHQNAVVGGAELHLLAVAHYFRDSSAVVLFSDGPLRAKLQKAGVQVRVNATRWAQQGVRGGVPHLNPSGVLAVLRLACSVAAKARGFDLIYANSPKALTIAWLAGFLARRPVLWAFHDLLDSTHFSRAAMRQMNTVAHWGADRIVACSAASGASLIRCGVSAERIHVVHPGIDPATCTEDAAKIGSLRRELSLTDGPVVGVFGRVTQWKGQHVAIELLQRLPELQLLIVGDASEEPSFADALKRRAAQLGVGDRLRMLEHRDDVPDLMRLVDIVLHTSVAPEPFGRVIVEAMLARKPIVASNAGGVPEIVEDGISAVLVPPGDVEALTTAVAALLSEPDRARSLGEAGYRRAETQFALSAMLKSLARHVDEVSRR